VPQVPAKSLPEITNHHDQNDDLVQLISIPAGGGAAVTAHLGIPKSDWSANAAPLPALFEARHGRREQALRPKEQKNADFAA
jgi:hypothetical protein